MGRALRIEGSCITYYISSEGKIGQKIFMDDMDRLYLINLLRQQKFKNKLIFYAYVLLKDQYAFLMETSKNNLCKSMHQINSEYVNFFNRRHKRQNNLFKDRYRCFVVDKDKYLTEVSNYIHSLPIKVGEAKSLVLCRWSSLRGYINKEKREDWIDYNLILREISKHTSNPSFNYKAYISKKIKMGVTSPFKHLKANMILGSEEFKKKVEENLHSKKNGSPKDEIAVAKKIIKCVKKSVVWTPILTRNASIYFIKKYTDLNNQEISALYNSLNKTSISQMSRRFRIAAENDNIIEKTAKKLENEIIKLTS